MPKTLAVPKPAMPWEIAYDAEQNVATVRIQEKSRQYERWFLLTADHHIDNPMCNRAMYRKHLEQARERDAGVFAFGDMFCVMQGPGDKRASLSSLREDHKSSDYFNRVVSDAVEFHRPFARNMAFVGYGNHETAVTKKYGWDITQDFVRELGHAESPCVKGGYAGFIRFLVNRNNTRSSRNLWYTHGYGGGGPVTMDAIQGQRQMAYVRNADIMVSGHTHDSWVMERQYIELLASGRVVQKTVVQVKLPTYKDEFRNAAGGWHIETGKPPKPIGAYWLRLYGDADGMVEFEVTRAK